MQVSSYEEGHAQAFPSMCLFRLTASYRLPRLVVATSGRELPQTRRTDATVKAPRREQCDTEDSESFREQKLKT